MKLFIGIVGVLVIVMLQAFAGAIQSEISTTLALEQFENPTFKTDTASRLYNNSSFFPIVYTGWIVIVGFLYKKEIIDIFDTKKDENE